LWCKFDGRIIANLLRLLFWRGCSLLDDQHSCAGGGQLNITIFRKENHFEIAEGKASFDLYENNRQYFLFLQLGLFVTKWHNLISSI